MSQVEGTQRVLERLGAWGRLRPDVRAVVVVGSWARPVDHPADQWSDVDVLLTTTDPGRYHLSTMDWLEGLGDPWLTYIETPPLGGAEQRERRVVFEGAVEVDFAVVASRDMRLAVYILTALRRFPLAVRLLPKRFAERLGALPEVVWRGMRILVDKDGTAARLQRLAPHLRPRRRPPSENDFLALVQRYWHGPIWMAKHLRRGELWRVKTLAEAPRHLMLLQMLEWHACARNGWDYDTWDRGRFVEEWADPRARVGLREVFARYDAGDTWQALFASLDLFRWLATETANSLAYHYPLELDQHVTDWVTEFRSKDAGSAV
jgi:aminoglycoside 6-adenylyltransferase